MEGTSSQAMSSPLTYPDQWRDDNLVEFLLKLIGATLEKFRLALLVWLSTSEQVLHTNTIKSLRVFFRTR